MVDDKNKLSLHINEKDITTMNSGFVDVATSIVITKRLTLNKETISGFNSNSQSIPPPWTGLCSDHNGGSCHCPLTITNCGSNCICLPPPTLAYRTCGISTVNNASDLNYPGCCT